MNPFGPVQEKVAFGTSVAVKLTVSPGHIEPLLPAVTVQEIQLFTVILITSVSWHPVASVPVKIAT